MKTIHYYENHRFVATIKGSLADIARVWRKRLVSPSKGRGTLRISQEHDMVVVITTDNNQLMWTRRPVYILGGAYT